MSSHLISFMVMIPFFGALLQALLPSSINAGWVALVSSLSSSICGFGLVALMQAGDPQMQMAEILPWVGSYAIGYEMAIDGLNILLVLLLSLVFPILITSEWEQPSGSRGMHALFLVLQGSLVGVVCAQDLFLQFFFWAMSALPFYFLVGIWGGKNRESAASRMIVTSVIGNSLFFAALVLIYYAVDPHTFSLKELAGGKLADKTISLFGTDFSISALSFSLMAIGLAMRSPIWPLHGWFTRVAEEAPASVFVALAGAAVPVSVYVFVRVAYSLFPDVVQWSSHGIVVIGMINLVMGGINAVAQTELSLLLAFVCMGQLGLLLMGVGSLNSAGVVGAVYHLLVLGLGVSGFGLFSGLIWERTGQTRFLSSGGSSLLGGLATRAPFLAVVVGFVLISLLGLPGTGGFVGQALLMIGGYSVHPVALAVAGLALMLATYYLLTMYRQVFFGAAREGVPAFADLSIREKAFFVPLVGLILAFGIFPKPFLELVRPTVLALLSTVK